MDTCPKCQRKLLSHTSAKCNWCGCTIDDPQYQQEAQNRREAFFLHDRIEQAIEIARIDMIPTLPGSMPTGTSYLPYIPTPVIVPVAVPVRKPAGAEAPPNAPDDPPDETGDRASFLDI